MSITSNNYKPTLLVFYMATPCHTIESVQESLKGAFVTCCMELVTINVNAISFPFSMSTGKTTPWKDLVIDFTQTTTFHGFRFITQTTRYRLRRYVPCHAKTCTLPTLANNY